MGGHDQAIDSLPTGALNATPDLLRGVPRDPSRVAVVHNGRGITFGEIASLSESVRRVVAFEQVGRRVVGVPADRSVDFVARMLGVWHAGSIPAVLGDWHADRVHSSLTCTGAVATFSPLSAPASLELVHSAKNDPAEPGTRTDGNPLPQASHILFTSGTTGTPKGIIVGRIAFESAITAFFEEMQIDESDRVAFLSRPGHDPSLRELIAPWHAGATLAIPDHRTAADPKLVAAWLRQNSITVLQGAPAFLRLLAEASSLPVECLRLVCSVGAQLTTAALASIARFAPRATIANCYGASETPQVVCSHKVPPGQAVASQGPVPIGRPLKHADVKVVPMEACEGGEGQEGVLHVEASACALGYTDGTALRTPDRRGRLWYNTGDVVRQLPDGSLCYVGRQDRQVQVNGARVELDEIEDAARQMGGVTDPVAELVEDGRGFGSVRLTVVRSPGATVDVNGLGAMLRRRLDPAVVPSNIDVRDSVRDDVSGGSVVPVPGETASGNGRPEDREALVGLLQECAQSALGEGRLDPDVGFLEAGFTSVSLMRFVAEASIRLELEISPVLVFRYPTMNTLADHLWKTTQLG